MSVDVRIAPCDLRSDIAVIFATSLLQRGVEVRGAVAMFHKSRNPKTGMLYQRVSKAQHMHLTKFSHSGQCSCSVLWCHSILVQNTIHQPWIMLRGRRYAHKILSHTLDSSPGSRSSCNSCIACGSCQRLKTPAALLFNTACPSLSNGRGTEGQNTTLSCAAWEKTRLLITARTLHPCPLHGQHASRTAADISVCIDAVQEQWRQVAQLHMG